MPPVPGDLRRTPLPGQPVHARGREAGLAVRHGGHGDLPRVSDSTARHCKQRLPPILSCRPPDEDDHSRLPLTAVKRLCHPKATQPFRTLRIFPQNSTEAPPGVRPWILWPARSEDRDRPPNPRPFGSKQPEGRLEPPSLGLIGWYRPESRNQPPSPGAPWCLSARKPGDTAGPVGPWFLPIRRPANSAGSKRPWFRPARRPDGTADARPREA
jgi:hypothetical protein